MSNESNDSVKVTSRQRMITQICLSALKSVYGRFTVLLHSQQFHQLCLLFSAQKAQIICSAPNSIQEKIFPIGAVGVLQGENIEC